MLECFACVLFQEFYDVMSYIQFLSHFEFIFVYGIRVCSNFIDLHAAVQLSQYHLLRRPAFLCCIVLPPLLKINYLQMCGFISEFSIMFHEFIGLLFVPAISQQVIQTSPGRFQEDHLLDSIVCKARILSYCLVLVLFFLLACTVSMESYEQQIY